MEASRHALGAIHVWGVAGLSHVHLEVSARPLPCWCCSCCKAKGQSCMHLYRAMSAHASADRLSACTAHAREIPKTKTTNTRTYALASNEIPK